MMCIKKHNFNLSGKTAVVVGGAGGLGREIVRALAYFGADVAAADLRIDTLESLEQELVANCGIRFGIYSVDVLDEKSVCGLMNAVASDFGRLDVLVNSAGMNILEKAEDYTLENWDRVIGLNLRGCFLTCREAAKFMITRGKGKIINMSSVRGQLGMPEGYSAYCSSKGGINMLTKTLASEWAKYGISVNAIAPTFIRTKINSKQLEDEAFYSKLIARIPMKRIGCHNDLEGPLLLFASDASNFITGQILTVDGGLTATQ